MNQVYELKRVLFILVLVLFTGVAYAQLASNRPMTAFISSDLKARLAASDSVKRLHPPQQVQKLPSERPLEELLPVTKLKQQPALPNRAAPAAAVNTARLPSNTSDVNKMKSRQRKRPAIPEQQAQ